MGEAEGREGWELEGLVKDLEIGVVTESDSGGVVGLGLEEEEEREKAREEILRVFLKTAGQGMATEEEAWRRNEEVYGEKGEGEEKIKKV